MTAPKPQTRNRYPERLIADLVEAERMAQGLSVEQAAELIGLTASSWDKKTQGVTPFKVDELGRLAEEWDAPDAWPFAQIQVRGKR